MATLSQERHVELVSAASQAFVITTRVNTAIVPNELPHLNAFVLSVPDVTDPKQDKLARVAMLADLTTLPIGRDPGIATPGPNGIEYLSASTTNSYDTLETALDAAQALRDRFNALVTDWIKFRTNFNAPDPSPALYTFPIIDASQKEALINAYTVAKQDRYQKQIAKDDADDTLSLAQSDYAYKQNLVAGAQTILTDAQLTQSDLVTAITQFGTLLTSSNAFFGAGQTFYQSNVGGVGASTFLIALNAYLGVLATATSQQSAMTTALTHAATLVADAANYKDARTTDASAASTTLTTAQATQLTTTQQLTSALALESAALAAVLAVCPDFDKHSIPFVPDNEP